MLDTHRACPTSTIGSMRSPARRGFVSAPSTSVHVARGLRCAVTSRTTTSWCCFTRTNADTLLYLDPLRSALKTRRGKLVVFVGNEVNLPGSPMADKIGFLRDVEADVIATQLVEEAGRVALPGVPRRHRRLGAPRAQPRGVPPDDRGRGPLDRYRHLVGPLCRLPGRRRPQPAVRVRLASRFRSQPHRRHQHRRPPRPGRLGGLSQPLQGTVSNEAGSWYLERDDRTARRIRAWVAETRGRSGVVIANDSRLRRLGHRLPGFVKDGLKALMRSGPIRHEMLLNETLDHAEIYARFFAETAPAPVYTKVVSSAPFRRHRHQDVPDSGARALQRRAGPRRALPRARPRFPPTSTR